MSRKSKAFKRDAMHDWALGMTYRDLAEKTGVATTTLLSWKAKNDPDNWVVYQNAVVRELQDAAIVKTKKQFASAVSGQLEDAISLRTLNRQMIIEFAEMLSTKVEVEIKGVVKIKSNITEPNAKILRNLASTSATIQSQMNHVFGLPTHRISDNSKGAPLSAFIDDDFDFENATEKEMVAYINNLNIDDADEG